MNKEDVILGNRATIFTESGYGAYTAVFPQVDVAFAEKYIDTLENEGYEKYTVSNFNSESGDKINLFATYVSDTYVVDLGYHSFADRLYVTYTPKQQGFVLPPKAAPEYQDKYPTILTQVGAERFHPAAVSMCYILRAADGSFVIIDSDFTEPMADLLYDILKKQAPDPDNIVISAWFFTHPHTDHVCGFIEFAKKYASDPSFKLKEVVMNFSSDELIYDNEKKLQKETIESAKLFGDDVIFVRPHAGNILYYADLTFRVLYTQEEYIAVSPVPNSNCCSLVIQMETKSGVKVLFGADHAVRGNYNGLLFCEGALYRWYDDFIKSDVVTAFHHGFGGGADIRVYNYIKPKIVFWPVTYFRLYNDADGTPYSSPVTKSSVNQYFVNPELAKQNDVDAYYISGDKIHIMDLSDNKLNVTEYETCDVYLDK